MASRRKKQTTGLIVCGVVILALAGTYFGISAYNKAQDDKKYAEESLEAQENIKKLSMISRLDGDYDQITYSNETGTYAFSYDKEDGWVYEGADHFPLQQSNISLMVTALSKLTATQVVVEDISNLAEYGLDNPAMKVVAKTVSGETDIVNIGTYSEVMDAYYAYKEGIDVVYLIGSTLPGYCKKSLMDLVSVEKVPIPEITSISNIAFENDATKWELEYQVKGDLTHAFYQGWTWFLKRGEEMDPADYTKSNDLITALSSVSISKCYDYDANEETLEKIGLDEAHAAKLSITYRDNAKAEETELEESTAQNGAGEDSDTESVMKELVLLIGKTDTETAKDQAEETSESQDVSDSFKPNADDEDTVTKQYYVRCADSTIVYFVSAENLEKVIGVRGEDLTNMTFGQISLTDVESIDITFGDNQKINYELFRQDVTDEDGNVTTETTYKMNGSDIDMVYVNAIYHELIQIKGDRALLDEEERVAYAPELEIVYHTSIPDFKTVTIGFTPYNSNYYQATVNGRDIALVNKRDITSATSDLEEALSVLDRLNAEE